MRTSKKALRRRALREFGLRSGAAIRDYAVGLVGDPFEADDLAVEAICEQLAAARDSAFDDNAAVREAAPRIERMCLERWNCFESAEGSYSFVLAPWASPDDKEAKDDEIDVAVATGRLEHLRMKRTGTGR